MKKSLSKKEFLTLSIMLFGMFFGAGNLIFPPLLGNKAGNLTLISLFSFSITAVVFPILGVIAVSKTKGLTNLSKRCGKYFSFIFTTLIYLSIGPGLGIPRAGSLPFEMAISPYLNENLNIFSLRLLYTFLFFLVAYLVCLKPNKLVNRMGKFLTPALLVLIFLMFLGVVLKVPMNVKDASLEYSKNPFVKGFLEGYNTMDAIAALNFGLVISLSIKSFGIEENLITKHTLKAGIISGSLLFIVYAMLSFIGMSTSKMYSDAKNGAFILSKITDFVFGPFGKILLISIFTLACLTTCIGLITSVSRYFENLTHKKISYNIWIFLWSFLSFFVANFGLNTILKISVPVLIFVYPISIVLIILSILEKYLCLDNKDYKIICYPTVFISLVEAFKSVNINLGFITNLVSKLPLFKISLGWVLPFILCIIFCIFKRKIFK